MHAYIHIQDGQSIQEELALISFLEPRVVVSASLREVCKSGSCAPGILRVLISLLWKAWACFISSGGQASPERPSLKDPKASRLDPHGDQHLGSTLRRSGFVHFLRYSLPA